MSDNPYSSPVTTDPIPSSRREGQYSFRSTEGLVTAAKIGVWCYGISGIATLMMTTVGTLRYPSFNDMEAELSDTTEQLLILGITGSTIISGLALLFTAIVTCMFMHRSSKNARALGATSMEFTPGWTVGVWFIPIINLFRPYSAMKEIQMASTNPSDGAWKSAEPLGLLAPWWACWLIGGIIERGVSRAELKGIDFGVGGLAVHWISGILLIASGFLLTQILGHILGLQNSAAKKTLR